jgi:tetratricopeptide (TPR) repeat protein
MANVAALRKKAADFEQKKQLDKAIAAYREILDVYDAGGDDNIDVGLYNRVGDLLVRQGNTPDAVTLYERAVDLYAEGGFFNNAIALCNKILRTSPGRATVYYKLGKISAAKGFNGDAKSNFLEYADRMQKSGHMEEAFRALKEFADLCPDQDDIRLMLAEQLTKADRKGEALEQLQMLHARYVGAGRAAEAQATFDRMKAIDPNAEVRAGSAGKRAKSDDLVFIDLDAPTPRASRITRGISTKIEIAPPPVPPPVAAPEPEVVPDLAIEPEAGIAPEIEIAAEPEVLVEPETVPRPVERTTRPSIRATSSSILGLETTSLGDAEIIDAAPLPVSAFAEIDLTAIPEAPTGPKPSASNLALPGDLPMIDLGGTPVDGTARVSKEMNESTLDIDLQMFEIHDPPEEPKFAEVVGEGSDEFIETEIVAEDNDAFTELVADAPETPTSFSTLPDEQIEQLPPPVRRTTSILANSVGMLRIRLEDEPENWALHREFAEALLDDGDREGGLKELEAALVGFERGNDLEAARSIADEIIRLNPGSVRYHQKRVEYAFRSNDKPRLSEAYVELADALFRDGQAEKAKQVYHRVLELSPEDMRARAALESFGTPRMPIEVAPPPTPRTSTRPFRAVTPSKGGRRYTAALEPPVLPPEEPAAKTAAPAGGDDDDFVSLGDWLRDQEAPKSTRMVVDEEAPTGDEQADFADMLKKFKQGVADNVDAEDHESHYDLGVAYKEMGLLDEAIAEFQKALRGHQHRVRTYEALGHCFLEKKQLPVAATILQRALSEPGARDEQLVGVLYLLGYVNESIGKPAEAKAFYERVFGVDIQFRDVGDRLNAVDKALAT